MQMSKQKTPLMLAVLVAVGLLGATLLVGRDTATAQTPESDTEKMAQALEALQDERQDTNLDSILAGIVRQHESGEFTAQAAASSAPVATEHSVAVTLYLKEGQIESVRDYLEQNGADPRNIGTDYIEAYVPVSRLADVSVQQGVISVRAIVPSQPAQAATGEAAAEHRADAWHAAGLTGEGVKIGLLNFFEGFSDHMGTELPATVQARCYTDIGVYTSDLADCETRGNYGTITTEAVFDIAPDADYYLVHHRSKGDFRESVDWLVEQGVDIMVFPGTYLWDGPGDGTSPFANSPLNSVDAGVSGGAVWAVPAGNQALTTWYGEVDKFELEDSDGSFQIFDDEPTDTCANVSLTGGELYAAQLRWQDAWGGATRDADLMLYELPSFTIVAHSSSIQGGGEEDDPFEFLAYIPETDGDYCLGVFYQSDINPDWIQLQSYFGYELQHATRNGSIGNPAESANPGLLAVGATRLGDTSAIADYSSAGPTPDDRIKPDITGLAGAYSQIAELHWASAGQSSAHLGGLLALVKQRFPEKTPQQLAQYLKDHALPRGTPVPNVDWGYGFAYLPQSEVADPCTEKVADYDTATGDRGSEVTISGSWDDECVSEREAPRGGTRYARYYTFDLRAEATVTIELTSTEDTYLYLTGEGVSYENDDIVSGNLNSRIEETLAAGGPYTIEATTYQAETTGDFTLTVSVVAPGTTTPTPTPEPGVPTPTPTPQPTPGPSTGYTEVSRGYDHACALDTNGSITCWGANDRGQASPPSGRFVSVSSDHKGSCAVRADGAVVCWGSFVVNP